MNIIVDGEMISFETLSPDEMLEAYKEQQNLFDYNIIPFAVLDDDYLCSNYQNDNISIIYWSTERAIESKELAAFKKYLHGDGLYEDGVFHNVVDSYGIYKGQEGKYCFFITDSERGIPQYLDALDSESEACEALYEMISLFKKAYREK